MEPNSDAIPIRQIRAMHDREVVRVYQAYSHPIAEAALASQTFPSPPFKRDRMTWIKPSFLWMMYRAGWGLKDAGQARILAIDISREGFDWALEHGTPTSTEHGSNGSKTAPVLIQWDPERDLRLQPQPYRAIQIGLRGEAVRRYVDEWIRAINDVTGLARRIHELMTAGDLTEATRLLPREVPYDWPGAAAALPHHH